MKKKSWVSLVIAVLFTISAFAQLSVQQLRTENMDNPLGVGTLYPRFSWQLTAGVRNTFQTAYAITVFDDASPAQPIWQSGKKISDRSVYVPYGGLQLQSGKKYRWEVRVWDNHGNTAMSSIAFFQVGLLTVHDWKAKWIEPGYIEDSIQRPTPLFRKTFNIQKKLVSATAYITAHGLYEARLNGKRIGDSYLSPGWTSYRNRLQYQAYDVTDLVAGGENVLGVTLGSGWYRGYIAFANNHNYYGKDIALLMQVDMVFSDGTSQSIITDESWKSNTGSVRSSEIYHGETIDARQEKQGWLLAGYNDAGWYGVKTANHPMNTLVATINEPVKKHEVFHPVKIFRTPAGEQVIDFGQNLVGWVVLKVSGKPGDSIVVSHAEVLDKAGNFYTANLRAAKAEDIYILKGGGEEIFEPHFTWHGFRYIRLYGYPGEIKPENFTAVTLYSAMPETGSFHTSNTLVNQLQKNIVWGQKGNFLDVPTDCPQRDERLGWTGDAQVFSRTASFNMDVHNFFSKWLRDMAADQQLDGSVPHVIPNVLGAGATASAGWADAATIIPWNMYLAYGDTQLLGNQYASMKAWVDYMQHKSRNDLWNTGSHFGDWLFYRPDDDNSGRAAVTDKYLIAQCFYAYSTQLLVNAARVLGRKDDVTFYTGLLERIRAAFRNEYVTGNGRLVSGTQTAYVLALNFDMLLETQRSQAVQRLVENITSYGNHLTTGFLGTPYLCHVLSRYGHTDIAYRLLLQETYPSWLYPVKMGATTIWERWDGIKPDGNFQVPSMNSYNHYAYGAIGDWMYRVMAGLDTEDDGPGYKHIRIQPHTGGGFTEVSSSLQTHYGRLSGSWKMQDGKLLMDVEVPVNTKATVYIPATGKASITESGMPVKNGRQEKDYRVMELGSGKYHFIVNQ